MFLLKQVLLKDIVQSKPHTLDSFLCSPFRKDMQSCQERYDMQAYNYIAIVYGVAKRNSICASFKVVLDSGDL